MSEVKEKVGLKIVDLIHEITRAGYEVSFAPDLEGMVRLHVEAVKPWLPPSRDEHEHLGHPGCERIVLEKHIIASLARFRDRIKCT